MIRYSRPMSWALASKWPVGGRRNTDRVPSAPVTPNVGFERPPAMRSNRNGAVAPATLAANHALTLASLIPVGAFVMAITVAPGSGRILVAVALACGHGHRC